MERGQDREVTIRLEEQSRRFARDKSRAVIGRVSINAGSQRTRITVSAENLVAGRARYKMFLIGRKDGNSVYKVIGDMVPDRKGQAELRAVVDPANVDGEGTSLSCFYIFMIAAEGMPLQPVLKGDVKMASPVGHEEPPAKNKNSDTAVQNEKGLQIAGRRKEYNSYYSEYIRQRVQYLLDAADTLTPITPFEGKWLADNWKRVTDPMEFPVASMGGREQIQKYGHFIFASDSDNFLLAVPGRHTDEEWPDRGASGFMMWQPILNSREYGYWCMVIDRKTGTITNLAD